MNAHTNLIDRYFDAWNETDGARRRELIAATWARDADYRDGERGAAHAEEALEVGLEPDLEEEDDDADLARTDGRVRLRKWREEIGKECAADHHKHEVGGDQGE